MLLVVSLSLLFFFSLTLPLLHSSFPPSLNTYRLAERAEQKGAHHVDLGGREEGEEGRGRLCPLGVGSEGEGGVRRLGGHGLFWCGVVEGWREGWKEEGRDEKSGGIV